MLEHSIIQEKTHSYVMYQIENILIIVLW